MEGGDCLTQHGFYMERAIALAKKGMGFVSPNPLVGAVVVKNGRILGEGYHARYGDLHAERNALRACTENPAGATLYVTLEPCCHYGKQPPCTDAVIAAGISTVYVGSRDPNPLVAGKGIAKLREAGITVISDFMREACDTLNPIFFHYITTGTPYVIGKYAMTADGKIACCGGASKWVTGVAAREQVQQTRKRVSAILVGIGTVLADDPLLTCRCEQPSHPVRVVCDTHLRLPLSSQLVRTARKVPVVVLTCCKDEEKQQALQQAGVTVLQTESEPETGRVSLPDGLRKLAAQKIDSVLLEGGAALLTTALQQRCVQELQVYLAPKLFGGDGISPTASMGITDPAQAILWERPTVQQLGDDVLLTYLHRREEAMSCSPEL